MPLPCDIEILEEHVQDLVENSYSVCDSEVPIELSPEDLEIIETGSWCSWQPTYEVVTPPGDAIGLDPTHPGTVQITTLIKDYVYDKLTNDFDAYKATLEGNIAVNYTSKTEYSDEWSAYAGQMNASYAQLASGTAAQTTQLMTAITDQNQALSTLVSETQAQFQDGLLAATNLYQQSYSTATEAIAAVGATAWLTDPVTGKSVLSGFKATASSNSGSEFAVFADNFYIATGTVSGDGVEIEALHKPFQVVGNTVYIGEVDTSKPQITYIGEYASAPVTTQLSAVYKNTSNGNSYIWNGTSWVLWLTKGADGLPGTPGAAGTRGSIAVAINGSFSSGAQTSTDFANATGSAVKVMGDNVEYRNVSTGSIRYYRTSGDNWSEMSLIVTGNMLVKGAITGQYGTFDNSGGNTTSTVSGFVGLTTCVNINSAGTSMGLACRGGNHGIIAEAYNSGGYGVAALSSGAGGIGVKGINTSSGGDGVQGENTGGGVGIRGTSSHQAVRGDTTNAAGTWGVITYQKIYAAMGFSSPVTTISFTGGHTCFSNKELVIGDIVSVTDAQLIAVDQSYTFVSTTNKVADKNVFGVVSRIIDDVEVNLRDYTAIRIPTVIQITRDILDDEGKAIDAEVRETTEYLEYHPEFKPFVDMLIDGGFKDITANAIGEGGINVCSLGGDIEAGDYICTSAMPGKGMKQDDDLLHNYTVAKALEGVVWDEEVVGIAGCREVDGIKYKMIACTYHCG